MKAAWAKSHGAAIGMALAMLLAILPPFMTGMAMCCASQIV